MALEPLLYIGQNASGNTSSGLSESRFAPLEGILDHAHRKSERQRRAVLPYHTISGTKLHVSVMKRMTPKPPSRPAAEAAIEFIIASMSEYNFKHSNSTLEDWT